MKLARILHEAFGCERRKRGIFGSITEARTRMYDSTIRARTFRTSTPLASKFRAICGLGLPAFLFCALVAIACNPFDMLDDMITYERMNDQESFRPYEARMPGVVPGAVPTEDGKIAGEERYRSAPPGSLKNPLPATEAVIARGGLGYEYYCIQCHGSKYNGDGTVGQSFAPLPTDLRSDYVQQMSDDELFRSISYGMMRHPALAYTVSLEDRWSLIRWIQSLGVREEAGEPIPSGDYNRSVKAIP